MACFTNFVKADEERKDTVEAWVEFGKKDA